MWSRALTRPLDKRQDYRVEVSEAVDKVAFGLVEDGGGDHRTVEVLSERRQQQVARQDWYEHIGVQHRHQGGHRAQPYSPSSSASRDI